MVTLLKTLLEMEGFEVSALDPEADVVQGVLEAQPDILLMDVHLLRLNGIEELRKLRATPGGQSVRVLMTSGLNFKAECKAGGANAFLQKPFMPDELITTLRSLS